jgi:hypothetical protein
MAPQIQQRTVDGLISVLTFSLLIFNVYLQHIYTKDVYMLILTLFSQDFSRKILNDTPEDGLVVSRNILGSR